MSKTLSQKGMSLVEIMVVAAILGFLGLAVSTTFTDLFRMQSRIVGNDEANEFGASVGRFIFSESSCSEALLNQKFPVKSKRNLALPGYMGFAFDADATKSGTPIKLKTVEKGIEIGNKLRIDDLVLADKNVPPETMVYDGKTVNRYVAEIMLITSSKVGKKWNTNPPRVYELPVLVNNKKEIVRCMTSSSVKDSCEALGSKLDPDTGKCTPQAQCMYEGSFTKHTCNNKLSCTPVPALCQDGTLCPKTGQCDDKKPCSEAEPCPNGKKDCPPNVPNPVNFKLSCPSGSGTQNQTGQTSWTFTYECGKKCTQTVNVNAEYFICLKCINTK